MTKREKKAGLIRSLLETNHHVEILQDRPYTAAVVSLQYGGKAYTEVGFAKVSWPDVWNPQYGANLAFTKAIYKIAKRILSE